MSYNLLDRDEIIVIAEDRRKEIEEQNATINEMNEHIAALENGNLQLYDEVQKLRCYKHAINALMFLYRFCKEEADK